MIKLLFLSASLSTAASAGEMAEKHRHGSAKIADLQDELAADVQQLIVEQTVQPVIKLLSEVEEIMDETTDKLAKSDTGGVTIAAQTEIIEKIHAAAKEKQKQKSGGQSGSAMMDMMERMMGNEPGRDKSGPGKDGKAGDQAGMGNGGLSGEENGAVGGTGDGKSEARRVPKASGSAGQTMPEEFRKALDAYNRGAEQKVK